MKHPLRLSILLVLLFFIAQLVGLSIVNEYVNIKESHERGITVKNNEAYERVGFEPPEVKNESISFVFIVVAVLIGTLLILLLMRFKKKNIWKIWYFLAVLSALLVALNPFIFKAMVFVGIANILSPYLTTFLVSLVLSILKILKPNVYVHNLTEILLYGGIAALLVPVINIFSATVLLVLISIYDAFAVWKSKHMIKLAEFQKSTKVFAGFSFPYATLKGPPAKPSKIKKCSGTESSAAILGGGDIAFPLLFSGVVMKTTGSMISPFIISLTAAAALFLLLIKAEKGRFYPAMPFISVGCFVGFFIVLALGMP